MARHRSFKIKRERKEPVTFDLEFEIEKEGEPAEGDSGYETRVESFTAVPEIPGGVLTDFVAAAGRQDASTGAALVEMITGVLIDEDVERFLEVAHSKRTIVPLETLADIVEGLTEEYTARPTEQPNSSRNGHGKTGATSKASSSSQAAKNP